MTTDDRLQRYAELVVRVGANVQPGQDVVVTCLVEHVAIARAMAREAFRAGAKHVVVNYGDLHLRRAAIELGPEPEIGWSAPNLLDWIRRWPEENPAVIALAGNPDPELLSDLDRGSSDERIRGLQDADVEGDTAGAVVPLHVKTVSGDVTVVRAVAAISA